MWLKGSLITKVFMEMCLAHVDWVPTLSLGTGTALEQDTQASALMQLPSYWGDCSKHMQKCSSQSISTCDKCHRRNGIE